jgi:hypothetical protein
MLARGIVWTAFVVVIAIFLSLIGMIFMPCGGTAPPPNPDPKPKTREEQCLGYLGFTTDGWECK